MKQRTVDKCWNEIKDFWNFTGEVFPEPTNEEKIAYAVRESTGKGEITEGFKFAKMWKTWQFTEWMRDLSTPDNGTGIRLIHPWEIPAQYQREVFQGAARIVERLTGRPHKDVLNSFIKNSVPPEGLREENNESATTPTDTA